MEQPEACTNRVSAAPRGIPGKTYPGREVLEGWVSIQQGTADGRFCLARMVEPAYDIVHFRGVGDKLVPQSQIEGQVGRSLPVILQIDPNQILAVTGRVFITSKLARSIWIIHQKVSQGEPDITPWVACPIIPVVLKTAPVDAHLQGMVSLGPYHIVHGLKQILGMTLGLASGVAELADQPVGESKQAD